MKDIEQLKDKFREMDKILYETEKDFSELKKFAKKFKEFSNKMKTLESFYHSDNWLNGRELIYKNQKNDEFFYSAGEDTIWDLSQEFYKEKIKLIQLVSKHL